MLNRNRMTVVLRLAVIATWALLVAAATLSGCSSETPPAPASSERVAQSVAEPLLCNSKACPSDCKIYTCQLVCTATGNVAPNGTGCLGGSRGTEAGVCVAGACCTGCISARGGATCLAGTSTSSCGSGGDSCAVCPHTADCTSESCTTGTCTHPPVADLTDCSTGRCVAGVCCGGCIDANGACQTGTSPGACGIAGGACATCDDKEPCTKDSCDPTQGCVHTPDDSAACSDGNPCTTVDKCSSGQCLGSVPPNCDDKSPCTKDACDPTQGCVHTPDDSAVCSDANPCTTVDKCSSGQCVGSVPPNCDDNLPCTKDTCDPTQGCVHAAVNGGSCDDGNACTVNDVCSNGKCAGTGMVCDDNNPCTKNACSVTAQSCAYPAETDGTPCALDKCHQNTACLQGRCTGGTAIDCNDNIDCTTDSCDPQIGCRHVPVSTGSCSDGDPCTQQDTCSNGTCSGTKVKCGALDECHKAGSCDPTTGGCTDPRQDNGFPCAGGTCQAGRCVLGGAAGASAGGATGTGEAGSAGAQTDAAGAAGETATGEAGQSGEAGATEAGGASAHAGASGSSSAAGGALNASGGLTPPEHVFVRNPGGCACRAASRPAGGSVGGLCLLSLVASGWAARRKRRRGAQRRSRLS